MSGDSIDDLEPCSDRRRGWALDEMEDAKDHVEIDSSDLRRSWKPSYGTAFRPSTKSSFDDDPPGFRRQLPTGLLLHECSGILESLEVPDVQRSVGSEEFDSFVRNDLTARVELRDEEEDLTEVDFGCSHQREEEVGGSRRSGSEGVELSLGLVGRDEVSVLEVDSLEESESFDLFLLRLLHSSPLHLIYDSFRLPPCLDEVDSPTSHRSQHRLHQRSRGKETTSEELLQCFLSPVSFEVVEGEELVEAEKERLLADEGGMEGGEVLKVRVEATIFRVVGVFQPRRVVRRFEGVEGGRWTGRYDEIGGRGGGRPGKRREGGEGVRNRRDLEVLV